MGHVSKLHNGMGPVAHEVYCLRCGKSLGMSNAPMRRFHRASAPSEVLGYAPPGKGMVEVLRKKGFTDIVSSPLTAGERVPSPTACSMCATELLAWKDIVFKGGVYWHCKGCHQYGVIEKCDFADTVRATLNLPAPADAGVEFHACSEHQELGFFPVPSTMESAANEADSSAV